jgi:hypothetical protein
VSDIANVGPYFVDFGRVGARFGCYYTGNVVVPH